MVCNNTVNQNIDNAANGALHANYLAGGPSARVVHIKRHVKTNVYSIGPHQFTQQSGSAEFGASKVSWKLSRAGDYLTSTWLRVELPAVTSQAALGAGLYLRWCHNLGHNLIQDMDFQFSSVSAFCADNFYLDFMSAFSVPAGKRNAYDNMIGNVPELVNPIFDLATAGGQVLPAAVLNVPLMLPYTRDVGVSLPTGALIYNDIQLQMDFARWEDLLLVSNGTNAAVGGLAANRSRKAAAADLVAAPSIAGKVELWGEYAVVTSDERKRMGKVPRDLIWEIVQSPSAQSHNGSSDMITVMLRFSHAVKAIMFSVRNKNEPSNYTTLPSLCYSTAGGLSVTEFPAPSALDTIQTVGLCYEGAKRLDDVPVDHFSLVQPYLHALSVPTVTGYHLFSYSYNMVSTDHLGSTDYGKLTNVSLELKLSQAAQDAAAGTPPAFVDENAAASVFPPGYAGIASLGETYTASESYESVVNALAHTVVRVIGGAAGFPIF